jgi:peptidylprolyl isomerase
VIGAAVCLHAEEGQAKERPRPSKEEVFAPENVKRLSEAYGHLVFKSLENPALKLDFDSVIKGLQDAKNGKPSPMTEQEYEETVANVQEYAFQEMAAKNLKDAESFLKKNASEKGVVELVKDKLQYVILEQGTGAEVTDQTTPVLHYIGKYADGTTFGNSYDAGEPVSISLQHTIQGFRQGVVGMKVGEKRRLFVHPDLGYGTSGQLLPNALLVFDIEIVKLEPVAKEEEAQQDPLVEEGDDEGEGEVDIEEEDLSEEA